MSEENIKTVREAFEAFLGGDQEKTAQLVDPEVEFHGTVGGLQEGQIAHGQSEIDERFEAEDLEAWEERRLEPEEFIDAGDNVVADARIPAGPRKWSRAGDRHGRCRCGSRWAGGSHPGLYGSRRGPQSRRDFGVGKRWTFV
jgi:ketosteroid isomerase-like protein